MVNRNFEYFDGTNMGTKNGIGLIERKKGKGMGSADIIYVKTCIKTCIGENDENYGKGVNNDCGKGVSKSVGKLVDNIVNEIFEPNTTTKNALLQEQNLNHSGTKNEPIEVQNLRPNNTELINNESNNINSIQINSKKNFKKEMELKGIENNRKSILEIKEEVFTDFNSEEILFKMLSTEGNQNVNGRNVTYAKVYDELVNYVKFETIVDHNRGEVREEWLIRELMENAISCYKNASLLNKIKYPIPYMTTCIWTAMENGNVKIHDLIRHDFQGCGLGMM